MGVSITYATDEWKWYGVTKRHDIGMHQDEKWASTCPDFTYRQIVCNHIYGVSLSKELRRKIVQEEIAQSPVVTKPVPCEKCQADGAIIKHGFRHNKNRDIQRYRCTNCIHKFRIRKSTRESKEGHSSTLPEFQRSVITKSLRSFAAILWNKAESRDNYQLGKEICRRCKTVCRFNRAEISKQNISC